MARASQELVPEKNNFTGAADKEKLRVIGTFDLVATSIGSEKVFTKTASQEYCYKTSVSALLIVSFGLFFIGLDQKVPHCLAFPSNLDLRCCL